MKRRLPAVVALIAFAVLSGPGVAPATDYFANPNPACRGMRNSVPGALFLPEPNRGDAHEAALLAGTGARSLLDHAPEVRRQFRDAFPILQKIDAGDTAALASLPANTPRIDGLIDRHLINLVWARTMLAIFYEEGRAPPVDYTQAGAFYRKAVETRFVDDRGCVHVEPPWPPAFLHLAGYYAYGVGVPHDPARARELLRRAGPEGKPLLTLLDHNALPRDIEAYLDILGNPSRLADRAYAADHPPAPSDMPNMMTWITQPDVALAAVTAPIQTAAIWGSLIVVALIVILAALWLAQKWRARLERRSPAYRAAFALYDVLQAVVSRIGLVAGGLIGCVTGLWLLIEALIFGLGGPLGLVMLVGGVIALLGGLAKLIEATRYSKPGATDAYGAARPAAESESQDAARGKARDEDLSKRNFRD